MMNFMAAAIVGLYHMVILTNGEVTCPFFSITLVKMVARHTVAFKLMRSLDKIAAIHTMWLLYTHTHTLFLLLSSKTFIFLKKLNSNCIHSMLQQIKIIYVKIKIITLLQVFN